MRLRPSPLLRCAAGGPWPETGEIDIMEVSGCVAGKVSGAVHMGRAPRHPQTRWKEKLKLKSWGEVSKRHGVTEARMKPMVWGTPMLTKLYVCMMYEWGAGCLMNSRVASTCKNCDCIETLASLQCCMMVFQGWVMPPTRSFWETSAFLFSVGLVLSQVVSIR